MRFGVESTEQRFIQYVAPKTKTNIQNIALSSCLRVLHRLYYSHFKIQGVCIQFPGDVATEKQHLGPQWGPLSIRF